MTILLRPFSLACLILILCAINTFAQEPPRSLVSEPIARELSGGQIHAYTIRLTANQIARVVAEQRDLDLAVSVITPDGVKLFEVDSPNGPGGRVTEEIATIAAQQSGLYRIEVRSVEKSAPSGRYAIRLDRFLSESEFVAERLAAVGRLWGEIKYFHPYLAYKDIDWDGALVRAVPQVKAARTPSQYRHAIGELLQALNDPATAVVPVSVEKGESVSTSKAPGYFRITDGNLIINVSDFANSRVSGDSAAFAKQQSVRAEIAKAKGFVLDCRYSGVAATPLRPILMRLYLNTVLPLLVNGNVLLGTERYRTHSGYAPQRGNSSGGYTSAFMTQAPDTIAGLASSKKPLALIVDEDTPDLVPLLSGLQASGAKIIQVGKSSRESNALTHQILLSDGVKVRIRMTEFVHPRGGSQFQANVQIPIDSASDERVISTAIAALSGSESEQAATASLSAPMLQTSKDATYPQMSFPPEEYRLLALFRFWNVINYFFPYKDLMDTPWETMLTRFIPRFLENKNQLDYEMTIAEMVAQLQDTHGFVGPLRSLDEHLGGFAPPLSLRVAGGKLTVASLLDEGAARAAGIAVGDVIVGVDGQRIEERIAYLSKFKALSNSSSAYSYVHPTALRGAKDTRAKLRVEGGDGQVRDVEMARTVAFGQAAFRRPRQTPIYRVLPNGYGYIDLARLPLADAQKAMDAVLNAPALIFDMRGYPNGTAWEIGPRLSEKKNFGVARFRRPFHSATIFNDEDLEGSEPDFAFVQKMPYPKGAVYKGKVVVLINEDAISQAEHTCLFFEAATNVTFIGSATNGANGDVTNLVLPGAIYVTFSGHDVRHADGRQLQRLGIQPHIKVEPTPKGIREGCDEVFEAAVKYLDSKLKK